MANEDKKVEVAVITTSGSYPKNGFDEVPEKQEVEKILKKAAHELHITDTTGWVAKVNGTPIDVTKTYAELGLAGKVEIDYGKPEGGGGAYARKALEGAF